MSANMAGDYYPWGDYYVQPVMPSTVSSWHNCSQCGYLIIQGQPHTCPQITVSSTPLISPTPHKCPCCDGWGKRDEVECPSCESGVLWR